MLRRVIQFTVLAAAAVYVAPPVATQSRPTPGVVLYEGARLIPGDGTPAIEQSAFLVEKGLISRVGAKGSITAPSGAARVDLSGKTVMPTIINTHGHPGFQRGLTYSADNFTRESVIDDLNRALYFGIAAVLSQGIEKGDVTFQVRAEQEAGKVGGARLAVAGRGIGAPNAGPGGAAYAGIAYEVTTEEQSRRAVQELAAKRVDVVKIWVDDRNGRAPRLPAEPVPRHHRRGTQARHEGQRPRLLLHRRGRPGRRRYRRPRASGPRQGDGRSAGRGDREEERLRDAEPQP